MMSKRWNKEYAEEVLKYLKEKEENKNKMEE